MSGMGALAGNWVTEQKSAPLEQRNLEFHKSCEAGRHPAEITITAIGTRVYNFGNWQWEVILRSFWPGRNLDFLRFVENWLIF